jgi:molybdopterin converting factor small subunit
VPTVWIPALLRELTGGQQSVQVPGKTVREVIDNLERRFPGVKERLVEEGRLRPTIALVVDGETSALKLRQPLQPDSEVYFLPAISGGDSQEYC